MRKFTAQKKSIKVLDFGCETGGELIGLLLAFYCIFDEETLVVEVHAVDGNRDAMNLARRLVDSFAEIVKMDVKLSLAERLISERDHLKSQMEDLGPFDIIVTSKFLCELNDMSDKLYRWSAASPMSLLAKDGIAVFMAITPLERGYRTEHGGERRGECPKGRGATPLKRCPF